MLLSLPNFTEAKPANRYSTQGLNIFFKTNFLNKVTNNRELGLGQNTGKKGDQYKKRKPLENISL